MARTHSTCTEQNSNKCKVLYLSLQTLRVLATCLSPQQWGFQGYLEYLLKTSPKTFNTNTGGQDLMLPALRQPVGGGWYVRDKYQNVEELFLLNGIEQPHSHPTLLLCDSSLYHQDAVRGKGCVRMHLLLPIIHIVAHLVGPSTLWEPRTEDRVGPLLQADLQAHTCKLC